uniref:Uncharacterized protein n=1 Tax=Nymphaea colorata TaxID=210225 RepID=A0A5K1FNV0_9MAGN
MPVAKEIAAVSEKCVEGGRRRI